MQNHEAPRAPDNGQLRPWSFGMFALGFFAWGAFGNGAVVFRGLFVGALLFAKRTGYKSFRDGIIVSANLAVLVTLLLLAVFGGAIFLFGARY